MWLDAAKGPFCRWTARYELSIVTHHCNKINKPHVYIIFFGGGGGGVQMGAAKSP
jgi:hypothetical protein